MWIRTFYALCAGVAACLSACAAQPSSNAPPMKTILADVYDTGWFEGDSAYHAVYIAPDGQIYFSVSSHMAQQFAHVYAFDPQARKVRLLWTADRTMPADGSISQGKIHSPLNEIGDDLFLATHDAWYYTDHTDPATGKTQAPFRAGYVVAVNKRTGAGRVIAVPLANRPTVAYVPTSGGWEKVPLAGESLIASCLDPQRGFLYALSWPGGLFVKVDVKNGAVKEFGAQALGGEAVPKTIEKNGKAEPNPDYQQVVRTLGIDDEGNVYGSRGNGEIWCYDPKVDRVRVTRARMEDGRGRTPAPQYAAKNQWRTLVWDPQDRVFYGVHHATSWLFRFDPRAEKVEAVIPWRPERARDDPVQKDLAQLGLALGPHHTLYGLVHANRLKPTAQRSVHLITYAIERKAFRDHGVVQTQDGSALMFSESCAVASNGDVYAVGWMEADEKNRERIKAVREKGPIEVHGYAYIMSLVRIPAERVQNEDLAPSH